VIEWHGTAFFLTCFSNTIEEFFRITDLMQRHYDPSSDHYELAGAQKADMSWKPMTEKVAQAEELIELAQNGNKTLLVDHTYVYTGAVRKIKQIIDRGELGKLMYYDSTRVNLGLFQEDINVIWDLAPHDISIMDYLMPFKKLAVSATGLHFFGDDWFQISFDGLPVWKRGRSHQCELGLSVENKADAYRRNVKDDRL
jgi:predicted dehydrogenase